ncbi:MAG: hypothetical protein QOD88_623, partial [Mycobacterium sp.]|nr:hypothetical protein [Mycobacterium sp.]
MDRRRVVVKAPRFGWDLPWPNAFEVAQVLPSDRWTLIGGLMVQVHAVAHQITTTRPTVDLDMLLHIEVLTGVTTEVAHKLTVLGYELEPPRRRNGPAYRFTRGRDHIDVMAADHAAPTISPMLHAFPMFKVAGGTQALRRTMIYEFERPDGRAVDFSVPDELGALVLKCAAYIADSR